MIDVPTLFEWIGGMPGIERVIAELYRRVPDEPLLAPVFAHMGADHVPHVTAFIAEVFGGPTTYSDNLGGHANMIRHHLGRSLTEPQRQRWMLLLVACADSCGAPTDPEFRSAFIAYFEWGSRLAVINSQPGVTATESVPMPRWGWGETKGPYSPK